ncbi:MAG: DsrE/DsrF/DrsH-like family protein [Thermoanaerobaculia bacterium]|nr:DsrE/DsrF/DrsH-like family protein [Thermoanaerobaculia bacterium]
MTVSEIDKGAASVEELAARLEVLESRVAEIEDSQPEDQIALIIFSGDLDKVLAGFVIATGAAALGQQVSMFFTFWGLSVLKKRSQLSGKSLFEKMMAAMTPSSSAGLGVSKMNFFGVGAKMLRKMMKDKGVASLEEMMAMAREMGVKMLACEMSRDVMGISEDELIDGLEPAGVASFLGESLRSRTNLFI